MIKRALRKPDGRQLILYARELQANEVSLS